MADETLKGITDVSFPIMSGEGLAQAALTMPFLFWVSNRVQLQRASRHLYDAAAQISASMGGELKKPAFPLVTQRARK